MYVTLCCVLPYLRALHRVALRCVWYIREGEEEVDGCVAGGPGSGLALGLGLDQR